MTTTDVRTVLPDHSSSDDEVAAQPETEEAHRQTAESTHATAGLSSSAVGMVMPRWVAFWRSMMTRCVQLFGYDADTLKQKTWQELDRP